MTVFLFDNHLNLVAHESYVNQLSSIINISCLFLSWYHKSNISEYTGVSGEALQVYAVYKTFHYIQVS